jgi:hypothetical protein
VLAGRRATAGDASRFVVVVRRFGGGRAVVDGCGRCDNGGRCRNRGGFGSGGRLGRGRLGRDRPVLGTGLGSGLGRLGRLRRNVDGCGRCLFRSSLLGRRGRRYSVDWGLGGLGGGSLLRSGLLDRLEFLRLLFTGQTITNSATF